MTNILGISSHYHDSAAALVQEGRIVAAAQEERFTRRKHDASFPKHAIRFCCEYAKLSDSDIDYVVYYEKPLAKFERWLESTVAYVPQGYLAFRQGLPNWVKEKLHIRSAIRQAFLKLKRRPLFVAHHEAHAASAFYPSPFDDAAILTMDGVGEWTTTSLGHGQGNRIELLSQLRFPHSLGLLYSAFTYYLGFRVNSGEYKLMGLAPYGKPIYASLIREKLVDLRDDGSLRLDMSYFNYGGGLTMTSPKFHKLFGLRPRSPESEFTAKQLDIAASIQHVAEEAMLKLANQVHRVTNSKQLVMAGGVALNCVGNGRLLRDGPFNEIWIQPAAGDAGGALGAALFSWHSILENPRSPQSMDSQSGSLLGPEFSDEAIAAMLKAKNANFELYSDFTEVCDATAQLLAEEKVIGWFQGRMEYGPRAFGSRSILADARSPVMQSVLNQKVKFRESFRPFAPMVLASHADRFFDLKPGYESPYMLLVDYVKAEHRIPINGGQSPSALLDRVRAVRSSIPAVTHVDYSARIQTIDQVRFPKAHQLLTAFFRQTGCPLLVNTSFNVRNEPIVCTPEDAYRCFLMTDIDILVLGRCLLHKSRQPAEHLRIDRSEHLRKFEID